MTQGVSEALNVKVLSTQKINPAVMGAGILGEGHKLQPVSQSNGLSAACLTDKTWPILM